MGYSCREEARCILTDPIDPVVVGVVDIAAAVDPIPARSGLGSNLGCNLGCSFAAGCSLLGSSFAAGHTAAAGRNRRMAVGEGRYGRRC